MKLAYLVSLLALSGTALAACDNRDTTPPETQLGQPATSLEDQAAADPAVAPGFAVGDRGAGSEVDNAVSLGTGDQAAGFIDEEPPAPAAAELDDSREPDPAEQGHQGVAH